MFENAIVLETQTSTGLPKLTIDLTNLKEILENEDYYRYFADRFYKKIEEIYETYGIQLEESKSAAELKQSEEKGGKYRRLLEPELKRIIRRPSIRLQMLSKCGNKAFLLPNAKPYPKFPVMAPELDKNGNVNSCEYHCGLIVAAWYRANQWKHKHPEYSKIAEKAYQLYKKLGCESKVPIHIKMETEIITPEGEIKKFNTLYEAYTYVFDVVIPYYYSKNLNGEEKKVETK